MKIYLLIDGQETGPFSKAEIFAKLNAGAAANETPARREDEAEWLPLRDIMTPRSLGLFSVEKIDEVQSAAWEGPVTVPDFLPVRKSDRDKAPHAGRSPWTIGIAVGVLTIGALGLVWWQWESPENEVVSESLQADSVPVAGVESVAASPSPEPAPPPPVVQTATSKGGETVREREAVEHETAAVVREEVPAPAPAPAIVPEVSAPAEPAEVVTAPSPEPVIEEAASIEPKSPAPPLPRAPASPKPKQVLSSRDFFSLQYVKLHKKPPKDGVGVWKLADPNNPKDKTEFLPCLEVRGSALENIRSDRMLARAYFYDASGKLLGTQGQPTPAGPPSQGAMFAMPVLFYKEKTDRFFFAIPEEVLDKTWKAVVVFGDRREAVAMCYPPTESHFLLNYPEKKLVDGRRTRTIVRRPAMDPLIEHVVKTRNPAMPQITLFLRPPRGVSDADEIKGVLAICVLASGVEDIKRELQKEEMPGDYGGLFSFANKNKLAVIAWGARTLWDPGRNYDQLSKDEAKKVDRSFDFVANAWERGVKELSEKYGIPNKNFLLWGSCGSAQWVARLCLRKPDYFLATHIHMPGSYDKPTPEAAKVLWCLTIGELEAGYERSKRWVAACREMGYPILYKAIVGLGHSGHADATALGFEFFDFALKHQEDRERMDAERTNPLSIRSERNDLDRPWLESFGNPPFYGDMVNQEIYPADDVDLIPEGFRIAIPTKELAQIWSKSQ